MASAHREDAQPRGVQVEQSAPERAQKGLTAPRPRGPRAAEGHAGWAAWAAACGVRGRAARRTWSKRTGETQNVWRHVPWEGTACQPGEARALRPTLPEGEQARVRQTPRPSDIECHKWAGSSSSAGLPLGRLWPASSQKIYNLGGKTEIRHPNPNPTVCVCYMTEHPLGHLHDTKRYGGGRQERKCGRRKGSGTTEDLPDVGVKESGRTEDVPKWARAEREVDESTTEDNLARRT